MEKAESLAFSEEKKCNQKHPKRLFQSIKWDKLVLSLTWDRKAIESSKGSIEEEEEPFLYAGINLPFWYPAKKW